MKAMASSPIGNASQLNADGADGGTSGTASMIALLIAFVATVVGGLYTDRWTELPHPSDRISSWRWWITPVERNAFLRLPVIEGSLRGVSASPSAEFVVAVGDHGLIVGTHDGGRSWQQGKIVGPNEASQSPKPPEQSKPPASAAWNFIPSANAAEAPPPPNTLNRSNYDYKPPRETKTETAAPTKNAPVQQSSPRLQPQVKSAPVTTKKSDSTTATATASATAALTPTTIDPTDATLLGVYTINANRAVAVGHAGKIGARQAVLLVTQDRGQTWRTIDRSANESPNAELQSVAFANEKDGVAVGNEVLFTHDGGDHWTRAEAPMGYAFFTVAPLTDGKWILGSNRGTFVSDDGGATWRAGTQSTGSVRWIAMLSPMHGLAISMSPSNLLETRDGGETWSVSQIKGWQDKRPANSQWDALAYGGRGRAILIFGNRLFVTNTAGDAFTLSYPTDANDAKAQLQSASYDERGRVWAVGPNSTLLRSDTNARHWRSMAWNAAQFAALQSAAGKDAKYARYPSPWLWVAACLLFAWTIAVVRQRRRQPELEVQSASITDAAASDRPIEWRDPDPAGLRDIAMGLSRFLRNRRTEPPLTIAVTGEWGTGKSSLMNLLQYDLKRYGYRPVWFNAWHHQSGENLLGSLLANIHAQGVPPLFTVAGLDFRISLLLIRMRRFWLRLAVTLFAVALVFFSYRTLGASAANFWKALVANDGTFDMSRLSAATGLFGMAVAALTPLLGALRAVSAFGLQPGKLIAAAATTKQDASAQQHAGARYQFAREFRDFTTALDPRTLVIFVDDLDRCRCENVIEVLEAINFLVSSGKCIVVLGMARRWVETCVGLAFKELAKAQVERSATDSDATEQQLFARNYLEKLINIEVRIPRLSDDASRALLEGGDEEKTPHGFRYKLGTVLLATLRPALVACGAGFVIWLGMLAAEELGVLDHRASERQIVAQEAIGAPDATRSPSGSSNEAIDMQRDVKPETSGAVAFTPGNADTASSAYWGIGTLGVLALMALGGVLLIARKEIRTNDSPAFRDALTILQPWILLGGTSPRSLKRFINNVRYIAMRFRPEPITLTLSERIVDRVAAWFGRSTPAITLRSSPRVQLNEELLVALACVNRCNERWIEDLFILRSDLDVVLAKELSLRIEDNYERQRVANRLRDALTEFNARFADSTLFVDQILDRRRAIAFQEVMALASDVREGVEDRPEGNVARMRS